MNENLTTLQIIESKVKVLIEQNQKIINLNETLKAENELLKNRIIEKQERVNELNNQLQILKLAKSVSSENVEQDKTELKKKINELIKEIDHCVALLNN